MTTNKQLAEYQTQQNPIQHIDLSKLALLRNRRQRKRFMIQRTMAGRIFETIAIASIVGSSLFGIGALASWTLETVYISANPTMPIGNEWRTRKHVCLGWMLIGFSSFVSSVSLIEKPHYQSHE